jgi:uncharacterized membrane protein
MPRAAHYLICLAAGTAAALARFIYMFFPVVPAVDLVLFGAIGYWLGRRRPGSWVGSVLLAVAPTMACIALILRNIGPARIADGVGLWHVVAAGLIPAVAVVAAWRGTRSRQETVPTASTA